MLSSSPSVIRHFALFFAAVLGLQAAWILAAELTRPAMPFLPGITVSAKTVAAKAASAAAAARLGWPRGELWVEYNVAANGSLLDDLGAGTTTGATAVNTTANDAGETAATLAPSDARNWVLLALNQQAAGNHGKSLAQLKMSYYTSPFNGDLFPLRIRIAANTANLTDDELASYVEYELSVILKQKPALKHSIALAYANGSPAGRQFLDRALATLDPAYLAQLKAAKP